VLRGDHEAAAAVAERLFSVASELNMTPGILSADSFAGWAMVQEGKLDEGFARLERSVQAWQATGARLHLPQRLSMLADGLSRTGRLQEALDTNAEARRLAETTGERWYQAVIQWQRGRLLSLRDGDAEGSEAPFRENLALARGQQAKSIELRAATSLAHLWRDRGEPRQACELLSPICAWFSEGRDTRELKDAEALLDALR
jgi:predicted ATPase